MGRSSGKKRAAVLGFLGLATTTAAETDVDHQGGAGWPHQQGRQYYRWPEEEYTAATDTTSKVRASDEDGFVEGRPWWYAERDIDRRASEFIDRVHRRITLAGDGPPPSSTHQY